eukprot:gene7296-367_t
MPKNGKHPYLGRESRCRHNARKPPAYWGRELLQGGAKQPKTANTLIESRCKAGPKCRERPPEALNGLGKSLPGALGVSRQVPPGGPRMRICVGNMQTRSGPGEPTWEPVLAYGGLLVGIIRGYITWGLMVEFGTSPAEGLVGAGIPRQGAGASSGSGLPRDGPCRNDPVTVPIGGKFWRESAGTDSLKIWNSHREISGNNTGSVCKLDQYNNNNYNRHPAGPGRRKTANTLNRGRKAAATGLDCRKTAYTLNVGVETPLQSRAKNVKDRNTLNIGVEQP